jgi:hypothetical protein
MVAGVPHTTYYAKFHTLIENILNKSIVIVACDPNDEDTVFAYGVAEVRGGDLVFHWFYCKHAFRNFGVVRAIEDEFKTIVHDRVVYTARSKVTDAAMIKRKYNYDPFIMWSYV